MKWTEIVAKLNVPWPMFRMFLEPLKVTGTPGLITLSIVDDAKEGREAILKHVANFYAPRIEAIAGCKVKVDEIYDEVKVKMT